jgi:hypothetical protein
MRRYLLPKADRGKFPRSTNRKETNVYKDNFQAHRACSSCSFGLWALGFGVLTSVAPASAATGGVTPSALTVGTIPTAQVGVAHATPITITAPTDTLTLGGSDTVTINVRVMSAPTGSAFRSLANQSKLASDGTTAVSMKQQL